MSISNLRRDYALGSLSEEAVEKNPITQFSRWLDDAIKAGVPEPTAMTLATVDEHGLPSARIVLLKLADERGFAFFTNYHSRKGREIAGNSHVALVLHWPELERQVNVQGVASKLSREESDAYFRSRPRLSRLAAWISKQSEEISGRGELEAKMEEIKARFPGDDIPLPPHWGGYIVKPSSIEFWHGRRSRLHDRLRFSRRADGGWDLARLSP